MGSLSPQAAASNWLSQLAPDHAPPPPGWWPPAPGWWLLAILMIAVTVAATLWWRYPPRRRRGAALRAIQRLETGGRDDATVARELEHLLRRYAVTHYGRDAVARLSGARWIEFVVSHGGKEWDGAAGADLLRLAYGGQASAHREHWFRGARAFVKSRKRVAS